MKFFRTVLQEGISDCGCCCLLSILRYYGGNETLSMIRTVTHTTTSGTTAYHLMEGAEALGFQTNAYQTVFSNLIHTTELRFPVIVHVVRDQTFFHFMVLYRVDLAKKRLYVMDPASGLTTYTYSAFETIWTGMVIELEPTVNLRHTKTHYETYQLLKRVFLERKKALGCIFCLSLLVTSCTIVQSFSLKIFIDYMFRQNTIQWMRLFLVIAFVFILVKAVSEFIRGKLLYVVMNQVDRELLLRIHTHFLHLPYYYFKNRSTGEILARISDLSQVRELLQTIILTVFVDLFLGVISVFFLYQISSLLLCFSLLIVVGYLLLACLFRKPISHAIQAVQELNGIHMNRFVETIVGMEVFRSLQLEERRHNSEIQLYQEVERRNQMFQNWFQRQKFFKDMMTGIFFLILFVIGSSLVFKHLLSISQFVTFLVLLFYFLDPIRRMIDLLPSIQICKHAFLRIEELLSVEEEPLLKGRTDCPYQTLQFEHFDLLINDTILVLKDITFSLEATSKVLLLGKSGSGKSSLLKSLVQYYPVLDRQIFIDQIDITTIDQTQCRRAIRYVSQQDILFTDTIQQNIVMGREVSEEFFLTICRICCVDEIVKGNSLGYDLLLEENGFNISGGERARIHLARALVDPFQILLLDETFHQLDVNQERLILKQLFRKYSDRLIIVVDHRLDNADLFDQLIEMREGTIHKILRKERRNYNETYD